MSFLQSRFLKLASPLPTFSAQGQRFWRSLAALLIVLACFVLLHPAPVLAGLNDDRYDGEIFSLYAGNGALVPAKVSLENTLKAHRPTLLVLYIDDSSDCKQYSTVISQLQGFYGRVADIIGIRVDSLPQKASFKPTEPGYYYKGVVPQTVLFDDAGKIVLNESGQLPFERLDDAFRDVFNLLPRSESVELKRRQLNEVTTELTR